MAAKSSQPTGQRVPVTSAGQRIPGLFSYLSADGTISYVWSRRVDGRMTRGRLTTTGRVGAECKTDAVNEYNGLFVDLARGEVVIPADRNLTLGQLVEDFLARERGPLGERSERTVALYRQRLSTTVAILGRSTRASDVTVVHVRSLLDRLKARNLSGSTTRGHIAALSAVYRHGVVRLGLARNPVTELQRGELPSGARTSEPRYLSVTEVESLLAKMTDSFRPVAACLFWGGLRISEALALRWQDVDFKAGTLIAPGTKTAASKAMLPLLPALAAELLAHRERQGKLGFERIAPDALVFQTTSGMSPGRRNALRAIQAAAGHAGLNAEGVAPVGAHDLRHSLAANSFALGLTPVEVARLLRHANPNVTLSVYAGITDSGVAALGTKLAAGLGGA
jgi:integrase